MCICTSLLRQCPMWLGSIPLLGSRLRKLLPLSRWSGCWGRASCHTNWTSGKNISLWLKSSPRGSLTMYSLSLSCENALSFRVLSMSTCRMLGTIYISVELFLTGKKERSIPNLKNGKNNAIVRLLLILISPMFSVKNVNIGSIKSVSKTKS